MNKHFTPAISEEKFAAWLDGMLPADEMQKVSRLVENDNAMHDIYVSSMITDDSLSQHSDEFALSEGSIFDDFELPSLNDNFPKLFDTDNYENGWNDGLMDFDLFTLEHETFRNPFGKEGAENEDIEIDNCQGDTLLDSNIEE